MNKHFLILAASLALGACSNGDDMPQMSAADKMTALPVAFHVGVAEATTRAGYPAGTLAEGAMGFYMQTAGSNSQDVRYNGVNRKVEYMGGEWTLGGSPLLWMNMDADVTWQAYYPHTNADITEGIMTVTIPTDQDKDGVYDLLYAHGTTTREKSTNGINIELKHLMSKFIVKLSAGTELGAVEFTSVVISDIFTQCEFEIYNNRWWDGLGVPGNVNMIKNADGSFEAMLIPYVTSQLNIDITLNDGRKFFYKRGTSEFKQGKVHTLNIKVGKDKVEASTMAASDWADDGRGTTLETN